MSNKQQKILYNTLVCEKCKNSFVVPRKQGQKRLKGHIKHMYCLYCKEVQAFSEVYEKDENIRFWDNWQSNFK